MKVVEERKYYLCIEYKNLESSQYGKCYVTFDENQKLNYDYLNLYTLEEIDTFLKSYPKEKILNQMRTDNIFYFLKEDVENTNFELSIRFYQNGKERTIMPLSNESLQFDLETFLKTELNEEKKKLIYNNLGGYLNNPHISSEMKTWIKMIRNDSKETLLFQYQSIPYVDRRKIKNIIFELFLKESKENKESQTKLLVRKKVQDKEAA